MAQCYEPHRTAADTDPTQDVPIFWQLGIRARQAGHQVLFATASQWVDRLAEDTNTQLSACRHYMTWTKLVVTGESGWHPWR